MLGSEQGVKDEAPLRVVLPTRKPANLTVASRTPSSKALTVSRCAPELCSHHMPGGGKEEIKCPSLTFITFRFVMRLCHGHQTPDPPVRICPVRPIRHHCAALRGERERRFVVRTPHSPILLWQTWSIPTCNFACCAHLPMGCLVHLE